jgi:hypothetical protein
MVAEDTVMGEMMVAPMMAVHHDGRITEVGR